MNEEYLWDKSGEPDPEIQQLEEILGTLRYQPQPLEVPVELQVERRRFYFPFLAIAAALAVALLAAGLWLRVQSQKTPASGEQARQARVLPTGRPDVPTPEVARDNVLAPKSDNKIVSPPTRHLQSLVVGNVRHAKNSRDAAFEAKERQEALAAKEQLMMALRVASVKLNLAQRRAQTQTPANLNRNQHKVG